MMPNWLQAFNNDWVKSTAALVIGWSLNALTPYIAERRERRKAISRALADLMEVRRQLFVVEFALGELGKVATIPPEIEVQARLFFSQLLLPNLDEMRKRYNESVTTLSSLEPLLGSELRLKDFGQSLLNTLNQVVAQTQDVQAANLWKQINTLALKEADDSLSGLIKKLALKRSLWTRIRVAKKLSSGDLPKSTDALLELLRKEVAKHQQQKPPDDASKGAPAG
jgi:hypothetical protein